MASLAPGDSSQFGGGEGSPHKIAHEKLEDGVQWYFSRKEIEENSPSRHDGIDLKKETYLCKSYCTFLQDLGMRLKVPQVTIATAIIFCHWFYLRQSHAKNDRRTIATTCMFLAGKVEETPRPLKDVILVSYKIIHKKDPAAIQKIKQKRSAIRCWSYMNRIEHHQTKVVKLRVVLQEGLPTGLHQKHQLKSKRQIVILLKLGLPQRQDPLNHQPLLNCLITQTNILDS